MKQAELNRILTVSQAALARGGMLAWGQGGREVKIPCKSANAAVPRAKVQK